MCNFQDGWVCRYMRLKFFSASGFCCGVRSVRLFICIFWLFISTVFPCYGQQIVFTGKVMGPVTNLFSVSVPAELSAQTAGGRSQRPEKITEHIQWRDVDPDVSRTGLVAFASNREAHAGIDLSRSSESFDIFLAGDDGVQVLTRTAEDEMMPKFSPDGDLLAFIRERSALVLLEMASRKEHVVYQAEEVLDFSWAPDSTAIAVAARSHERGRIVLIDCGDGCVPEKNAYRDLIRFQRLPDSAGAASEIGCVECGSALALSWSPQGNRLAYIFHPDFVGDRRLQVIDLDGTQLLTLSQNGQQVQDSPSWSPDGSSILYAALVDYQFQYDEAERRKKYRGSLQVFRAQLDGEPVLVAGSMAAARAPVFLGADKFAYLKSDSLVARHYALVISDFAQGSESVVFDRVARNAKLVVRP